MSFLRLRRPLALAIVVCCSLVFSAATADDQRPRDGAASPRLYAVADGFVRLDPDTLRAVRGQRAALGSDSWAWSFAPGREHIALVSDSPGPELRLIDLPTMRVIGDARLARRGSAWATAWVAPRRLLGVVVTRADDTVVVGVDAVTRKVLWRRTLGGSLRVGEAFHNGLVLILGPRHDVGPSRLVRVSASGGLRAAPLAEIRSGLAGSLDSRPGLAIDHAGARAFVVQAGSPVAEVDLRSFQVREHLPLLRGRTPDARTGATRDALWLGSGLAITGWDTRKSGRATPAGLTVVDTLAWTARTIDRRATEAIVARGTLLASSFPYSGRGKLGSGVTGYSLAGAKKFHRYGDEPVAGMQLLGSNVVVMTPRRATLIDARTGRELRRYQRPLLGTPVFGDRSFPPTADG